MKKGPLPGGAFLYGPNVAPDPVESGGGAAFKQPARRLAHPWVTSLRGGVQGRRLDEGARHAHKIRPSPLRAN